MTETMCHRFCKKRIW